MFHFLERELIINNKYGYVLLLVIFIILTCRANAGKMKFEIDDAVFYEGNGLFRWEFYYSFDENTLKYKLSEKGLLGELFIHVSVYSNIKLETEKKWVVSHQINKADSSLDKSMVGQKNFSLKSGQYKINVYLQDVNDSTSSSEINFDLFIRQAEKENIFLSSLQLAQNTEESGKSGLKWNEAFRKNNFYIMPNPSLIFIANKQKLNCYLEIYYSKLNDNDSIDICYSILDIYENKLSETNKRLEAKKDLLIDINEFDIIEYETGTYFLRAAAVKQGGLDSTLTDKKFYILNPLVLKKKKEQFYESLTYERSEFASLNDKQTDVEVAKIKPIASSIELSEFAMLSTGDAKRRLLFRFWQNRDSDTNTIFNEALFNYRELIAFANRFFSFSKTEGWQTDRGRILLKYGMPTEREQYPFDSETRAYESWFYSEIQGGVYFHFVDMTGYGRYELVHSTAQFELQYENWYNEYVLKQRNDYDNSNEYQNK